MLNVEDAYFNSNYNVANLFFHDDIMDESIKWQGRLGHIGQDCMKILAREGLLGLLTKVELSICEPCLMGKLIRKPFRRA